MNSVQTKHSVQVICRCSHGKIDIFRNWEWRCSDVPMFGFSNGDVKLGGRDSSDIPVCRCSYHILRRSDVFPKFRRVDFLG